LNKKNIACLAMCLALLAGCGGGGQDPQSADGRSASTVQLPPSDAAKVGAALCEEPSADYRLVQGQCFRSSPLLQSLPASEPRLAAADSLTAESFMDWAEDRFPQFFSPARPITRSLTTSTGDVYTYRQYEGTQNILAEAGGIVYVLGPITGNALARIGPLSDFMCQVVPGNCTVVTLTSDAGDYVGGGGSYRYTAADSVIQVTASGNYLQIDISGDESWTGQFQLGSSYDRLQPGQHADLMRYPFHNPVLGGLSWIGEGRGCNTLSGSITIESATYVGTTLSAIALSFVQHCENAPAALRGTIQWSASDPTKPPGPLPVPADLWRPSPESVPAAGDYVYLRSDAGDWIGQGQTYLYTGANALMSLAQSNGLATVGVRGNQSWTGNFDAMNSLAQLTVGYYPGLQRYPFHNPVKGGLNWSGEGRGCNTLTGWFAVDDIAFTSGVVSRIKLRFEQHCEGGTPALRGEINWGS
jgi:hypothetical protein